MLPSLSQVAQVARIATRLQPVRCMSAGHIALKSVRQRALDQQASMDHMLVPEGDWKEDFDRRNRKYNIQLVVSIVSFIGVLLALKGRTDLYEYRLPGKQQYNIYDHLGVDNPEVDASVEKMKEILNKMD